MIAMSESALTDKAIMLQGVEAWGMTEW